MGMRFNDRKLANEQVERFNDAGYSATITKKGNDYFVDRGNESNKGDERNLIELKGENEELEARMENIREASGGTKVGLVGNVARGFGNIARSLSTPRNKRRMRIAQMVDGKDAPMRRVRVQNPIAGKMAGMNHHKVSDAPD